jgi:hypothetical protein
MADLAATVVESGEDLRQGATWRMGGPLWRGTELSFFLTLHQHALLEPLVAVNSDRVEFFNAIPIFDYEAKLKKARGLNELKQWWKENRVRFWDPTRSPVEASTTVSLPVRPAERGSTV